MYVQFFWNIVKLGYKDKHHLFLVFFYTISVEMYEYEYELSFLFLIPTTTANDLQLGRISIPDNIHYCF